MKKYLILLLGLMAAAGAWAKVPTITGTRWSKHTDQAELRQQYRANRAIWDSVFAWVDAHHDELLTMPAGKYYVCDTVMIRIQDATTRDASKIEAHRRYIDLQWDMQGTEVYELWKPSDIEVMTPYRPDKDVEHYSEKSATAPVVMTSSPDTVFLFFPRNPHRAMLYPLGTAPAPVRKLVVKIPYASPVR